MAENLGRNVAREKMEASVKMAWNRAILYRETMVHGSHSVLVTRAIALLQVIA